MKIWNWLHHINIYAYMFIYGEYYRTTTSDVAEEYLMRWECVHGMK